MSITTQTSALLATGPETPDYEAFTDEVLDYIDRQSSHKKPVTPVDASQLHQLNSSTFAALQCQQSSRRCAVLAFRQPCI